MSALEEASAREEPFTEQHAALWKQLEQRVRSILPDLDLFEGERNKELTHEGSGLQLSMFPGEISVTVPYWYEGAEARADAETLRSIASVVEEVTGLTAYDPQSEQPFLEGGADSAPQVFQQVHDSFADRGIASGQGAAPATGQQKKPSRWRKLFGGAE